MIFYKKYHGQKLQSQRKTGMLNSTMEIDKDIIDNEIFSQKVNNIQELAVNNIQELAHDAKWCSFIWKITPMNATKTRITAGHATLIEWFSCTKITREILELNTHFPETYMES